MTSILSVSQINTYLKSIIEDDINLRNIYISGEISNFTNHYRTGHLYFTLKDDKGAIKAVMFRQSASRLRFIPENGMQVLIRGSVGVYESGGVYQIYCDDMIPEGLGELTIAYEQLKSKLEDMGLFRAEHKKPIPEMPKKVGVITSPTGAALQDILSVLERRFPLAEVVFEGVQVQGDSAAPQIAAAIDKFSALRAADVLIVGRGGGSIEDLWAFNEEIVAMAIYNCDIPVISAVGHETDFTIADFVADLRAPTPSAAAELAVPDYRELLFSIDKTLDSLDDGINRAVDRYAVRLLQFKNILSGHSPEKTVILYSQLLSACEEKIRLTIKNKIDFYENALLHYSGKLEAISPLKVLLRGYAIVEDENGLTVKSSGEIASGSKIKVKMHDGDIHCTVN
ncbi:MAG: exodeoxyribonuclease VII large subunit [Clostridia bacterium]|nr:exodeoxyribonuclease VII large subunit [Clostridia bacterium]